MQGFWLRGRPLNGFSCYGYPLNYSCGHSGPVTCGKPVLRATVPSLCHVHSQKAQRSILQALKRAGLNLASSSRPAPKFSVLLAECVNQIQARRKELDAAVNDVDYIDEEVSWCMIWFITALSLWWWQRTSLTWSGHHLDGKCSSVHGYVFRVWLKVCQYSSLSAELVYLCCSLLLWIIDRNNLFSVLWSLFSFIANVLVLTTLFCFRYIAGLLWQQHMKIDGRRSNI